MPRAFQQGDEPVRGYRLVKFLGKGGFGDVWQASGPGGTECAFKIIQLTDKPGSVDLRQVELMKKVKHPNLCPILALWTTGGESKASGILQKKVAAATAALEQSTNAHTLGDINLDAEHDHDDKPRKETLFIAMGLAEKSLLDRFKECKEQGQFGIPTAELIGYFEDAARAVDHLNSPKHDLGDGPVALPHCNIKPQNLLIVGGAVQVCDHGLVRVLGDSRASLHPGASVAFTAPEMLDQGKPSVNSDQYSLAITYHYLRTGALPFSMNEANVVLTEALEGRLDLSRLSTAEQQVIRRACSRKPDARFPNCQDLARELRRAIERSGNVANDGLVIEPNREIVPGHKLVSLIGRGAYGEVWEALAPGRLPIALKIIKDLDRASGRGKQEFRALEIIQNISHHGLMELRAYWLLDRHGQPISDEVRGHAGAPVPATLIIATKLADMNLTQVLEKYKEQGKKGIPVQELLGHLRQVAVALDFLNQPRHTLGDRRVSIQHRDVKPDNIMLANESVKLTDFGLAKVMETDSVSAEIRQDSVGFTFHYAAPEVLRGKVTKWSDQYSLAITYFQLRTGLLPYGMECSAYDQMMRQLEGQLDLRPLLRAERQVVARATSVIPEERFATCQAFIEALSASVPAKGQLLEDDEIEPIQKSASLLLEKSGYHTRPQEPLIELLPVQVPQPAAPMVSRKSRQPDTMQVSLKPGELYPAPVRASVVTLPPVDRDTDPEVPPTKVMTAVESPSRVESEPEIARASVRDYLLPLSVVFAVGIGMAILVNQVLKHVNQPSLARQTSPTSTEFQSGYYTQHVPTSPTYNGGSTANKPSEIIPAVDQRPKPPLSQPPDLLAPPLNNSTPMPAQVFVLGMNVADSRFASHLDKSLDNFIASNVHPGSFSRSFRELEQVPNSHVTAKLLAYRAECLIEGEARNLPLAEQYLRQVTDYNLTTAYSHYVQARWYQEMRDPLRAASSLEESLRRDISLSQKGFRRDRALSIFEEAALRVNYVADARSLTASLATPVPSWLGIAEKIMDRSRPNPVLGMVVAVQAPAGKDPSIFQQLLTPAVMEDWSKKPQGPVVLVSLKLKQAEAAVAARQIEQALGIYVDTWNYIRKYRDAFDASNPLVIFLRVVDPGQKQAALLKAQPARQTQLASLLAAQGELISQSPGEAWSVPANKTVFRVAADAYGEAARLYPGVGRIKAEYLVGQVECLSRAGFLPAADIVQMNTTATTAIGADPTFAGSWNAQGLAKTAQHYQWLQANDISKALAEALTAFDQAVRLAEQSGQRDRRQAVYRSNRSLTKSMLGDFTPVAGNQRQGLYQDAIADAVRATELDAGYDLSWGSLGEARERLADLVRGAAANTIFSDAVAAYRKQVQLRPTLVRGYVHLARCLLRWGQADFRDTALLDQGRDELIKAIKISPDDGEAHLWLGRYYQAKNEGSRANEEYLRAIQQPGMLAAIQQLLLIEQKSPATWQWASTLAQLMESVAQKLSIAQAKVYREAALRTLDMALAQAPNDQKNALQRLKADIQAKVK